MTTQANTTSVPHLDVNDGHHIPKLGFGVDSSCRTTTYVGSRNSIPRTDASDPTRRRSDRSAGIWLGLDQPACGGDRDDRHRHEHQQHQPVGPERMPGRPAPGELAP